jgi:hypothetical protein
MNVNILSSLYARPDCSSSPFAARHAPPRKTAAALGHFSAHHPSVSPLRGTQMTEKWVTEKCAKHFGSPDRGMYAASTFAR